MAKKINKKTFKVSYPTQVLRPVTLFLKAQLDTLKKRKKEISREDPFKDVSRLENNASPDSDAEEQFGHARITAIKEQIDRNIIQVRKALTRINIGKYGICEDCGKMIDTDRLMIYPETTLCADDAKKREK